MDTKSSYNSAQLSVLVILRILMGWYCMYEGIAKLLNPNWSAGPYLMDSGGWFAGFFKSLTNNPDVLRIIDIVNIWGLIAIGAGLIIGFLARPASIAGIVLLSFYYLSHPPLVGVEYALPMEGNYLWVNKTLIEVFVFAILLVFPTSQKFGLDRLVFKKQYTGQ
jgi:thiosulfate dehydrogenase (quinone) large subunit